jgi:hypothetical protein
VFEEPGNWSGPFFTDEAGRFKLGELEASDALLLGRKTCEGFAAAWSSVTDQAGFTDMMNSMPKFVIASTLEHVDWRFMVHPILAGEVDICSLTGRRRRPSS